MKPDNNERKVAMFKNGQLRLLMTLVGFTCIGVEDDPEGTWLIPTPLTADKLKESLDLIKKSEFSPPTFDDGQEAGDFIRRKSAAPSARKKAIFDDEDGIDDHSEEEFDFAPGGPTAMKPSDALKELKKKRRLKRKGSEDADRGLTDEQAAARAEARRQKDLEKNRKIRSDLFVHDSDDEDDEERDKVFFEQERLREKAKDDLMRGLISKGVAKEPDAVVALRKKRDSSAISIDSDEDGTPARSKRRRSKDVDEDSEDEDAPVVSGRSSTTAKDDILADSEDEATDTPMSSPHAKPKPKPKSKGAKKRKVDLSDDDEEEELSKGPGAKESTAMVLDDEDEDEDVPVVKPARQRMRSGFVMDSSDEE